MALPSFHMVKVSGLVVVLFIDCEQHRISAYIDKGLVCLCAQWLVMQRS